MTSPLLTLGSAVAVPTILLASLATHPQQERPADIPPRLDARIVAVTERAAGVPIVHVRFSNHSRSPVSVFTPGRDYAKDWCGSIPCHHLFAIGGWLPRYKVVFPGENDGSGRQYGRPVVIAPQDSLDIPFYWPDPRVTLPGGRYSVEYRYCFTTEGHRQRYGDPPPAVNLFTGDLRSEEFAFTLTGTAGGELGAAPASSE